MIIEDRGNAVGATRSEHFLWDGDAVERILASSPLSIVTAVQRRPASFARHRREYMRADRLVGIADRDRNLDARIEHLAPIRYRLVGVAPHVKLLRRAADVDRDRLERELCLARRLGGVGFLGFGRLRGVLGRGTRVELRFASALAVSSCVRTSSALARPFALVLGLRLGLVRLGTGERFVGECELGVGAGLDRSSLRSDAVSVAASRAAVVAAFFASSAVLRPPPPHARGSRLARALPPLRPRSARTAQGGKSRPGPRRSER